MSTQPLPLVADDPLIGSSLAGYTVEQRLAEGGMGVVYRAKHPLIGRLAAIKVLKPEFAADKDQTDRFLKEAQALSAIKHRGIVEIIGFGNTPDGRQYMATEFLDGESLDAVMSREKPMTAMRVLGLADEILHALSAAHRSQVVHRDLKPSNVFLAVQSTGERIVKILDFGLAKLNPVTLLDVAEGPLTKASLVAGTPEYIAPEQARGLAATPRTDLYCLGVMMFEMLSGTLPFQGGSVVDMLKKHVYEAPPQLSGRVSNLPDGLYDLVMQLLEKDPEKRPPSAEVVRQAVQRLTRQLQQESTVQRPNPLRVVPAPFRLAEPDAPTPPLDPKMIATEPVFRTPTTDKLERELKQKNRGPIYVFAVAALGLLVFLLWPRGAQVAPPPPPVPAPAPAPAPVPPTPPAPELAVAPAPTEVKPAPAEEPLPALPPAPVSPKVKPVVVIEKPVEKPAVPSIAIDAPECEVNDRWRRAALAQVEDLAGMAARKSTQTGVWFEGQEARVTQKIRAAESRTQCAEVEAELGSLQRQLEKR